MNNNLLLQYLLYMHLNYPIHDAQVGPCMVQNSRSFYKNFNNVCCARTITHDDIHYITSYFGIIPWRIFVPKKDKQSLQILDQYVWASKNEYTALRMDLRTLKPHMPLDIEVHSIESSADRALWTTIAAQSFNYPEHEFKKFIEFVTVHAAQDALRLYIGFYKGEPAATSLSIQRGPVVTIHQVGTLVPYRRKGLGYATTYQAVSGAHKQGCTQAVLLASSEGRSMYESMGFTYYESYTVYENRVLC